MPRLHSSTVHTHPSSTQMQLRTLRGTNMVLGIAVKDNGGRLITPWSIPTPLKGDAAILEAHAIGIALLKALEEN